MKFLGRLRTNVAQPSTLPESNLGWRDNNNGINVSTSKDNGEYEYGSNNAKYTKSMQTKKILTLVSVDVKLCHTQILLYISSSRFPTPLIIIEWFHVV